MVLKDQLIQNSLMTPTNIDMNVCTCKQNIRKWGCALWMFWILWPWKCFHVWGNICKSLWWIHHQQLPYVQHLKKICFQILMMHYNNWKCYTPCVGWPCYKLHLYYNSIFYINMFLIKCWQMQNIYFEAK